MKSKPLSAIDVAKRLHDANKLVETFLRSVGWEQQLVGWWVWTKRILLKSGNKIEYIQFTASTSAEAHKWEDCLTDLTVGGTYIQEILTTVEEIHKAQLQCINDAKIKSLAATNPTGSVKDR